MVNPTETNQPKASENKNETSKPKLKKKHFTEWQHRWKLKGNRPPQVRLNYTIPLGLYLIPKLLFQHMRSPKKTSPLKLNDTLLRCFESSSKQKYGPHQLISLCQLPPTNKNTYVRVFKTLLYLEFLHQKAEIRQYDQYGILLDPDSGFHRIDVPGLGERRPSVLRGDAIWARYASDPESKEAPLLFEGYVHFVNCDDVRVSFHRDLFNVRNNTKFDVRFTLNPTTFNLMHRALESPFVAHLNSLPKLNSRSKKKPKNKNHRLYHRPAFKPQKKSYNRLNKKQSEAVYAAKRSPKYPLIIWGPPGTGKTTTVINIIKAVAESSPLSRILATAPSNTAADVICTGIIEEFGFNWAYNRILRLNGFQRDPKSVPKEIQPLCYRQRGPSGDTLSYSIPPLEELSNQKIIVSTCTSSGYLYSLGMERGHFSHIIIDEAGHACEPETLIPLCLAKPKETAVILAGDPMQLSAIVQSPISVKYQFDMSLMERLLRKPTSKSSSSSSSTSNSSSNPKNHDADSFQRPLFSVRQSSNYPKDLVVFLEESYRSYQRVFDVYNTIFYDRVMIARREDEPPPDLSQLKFINVQGYERREWDSPSWYNQQEVTQVLKTVKMLINAENNFYYPENIGIISPYKKQIHKIRQGLHSIREEFRQDVCDDVKLIKTGSVEEFQGDEKPVIIISTVRSVNAKESAQYDERYRIGFLKNPRRLNAAVSRAEDRLIIIGNAEFLKQQDPYWRQLVNQFNGATEYIG